jgi:hypothetical protein
MKPSRELDALVAERVMGWRFIGEFDLEMNGDRWAKNPDGHENYFSDVPHYSTNIAAAWEVMEKLLAYNPFWEQHDFIGIYLAPTSPKGWTCNFGDDTTRAYGDTAPHAICLAALKVVSL